MKTQTINTPQINIEKKQTNYYAYGIYFLIYSIVLISTVLFFVYSDNSKSFSVNTLGFVVLTFVILSIAIFYYYPTLKNKNMNSYLVYFMGGAVAIVSIISYIAMVVDEKSLQNIGIIILALIVVIAIIGLAIFFYIFGDYLKQRRGMLGLIINFIFFIPCLVIDLVEYFKRELILTTRTEYILLFIEIILILLYVYAAPLLNNALSSGTIYLLKTPIFLNKRTILLKGTDSLALPKKPDLLSQNSNVYFNSSKQSISTATESGIVQPDYYVTDSNNRYSSNFSISMWVYLNIQTKNFITNENVLMESTIFSYNKGKPKITYTNNTNEKQGRDSYNFYFTEKSTKPDYQTTLSSQKWNNIVFNYSSGKVDLFINGNLETTHKFDLNNRPPEYNDDDIIITGEDKTWLHGAICNIVYSQNNLMKSQIINNYNILMLKNPPLAQI